MELPKLLSHSSAMAKPDQRSLSMVNGSEFPFNQIQMMEMSINFAFISLREKYAKFIAEAVGILDDNPDNPAAIVYQESAAGKLRDPKSTTNLEFQNDLGLTNSSIKVDLWSYHRMERSVGAADTTTVVKRLNHMQDTAAFLFPAVNCPFTKIKYDSLVGCGYGDVGKPLCAVKPVMEALSEVVFGTADIMVDQYMRKMKNNSIDCNIGHYDNSFYMQHFEFKTQADKGMFPDAKGAIIPLAQGRLNNLGCATGHPSFVMFCSFTKQVIPQLELWNEKKSGKYEEKVYVLHKHPVEKVAAMNLQKLGAKLTKLSPEQAAYINVPIEGPYEPAHYRY